MQSTTAKVGLVVVLVAVAVGLFVVLSGGDDDSDSESTTTATAGAATTATTPAEPAPTAAIQVKGGEPVGGIAEVEVTKGDEVTIQVSSDQAGEVHVHGYEIEKPVKAGGTVEVPFTADIDGKFEIELHLAETEAQIAELTVQP